MSKHTPGPWEYIHKVGSDNFLVKGWDKRHTGKIINVAYVPNTIYRGDHGWPEHCERHNNAKLISAAPELLEALQTLVDNFGPMPSEKIKGLAEARAAIAKAKGETL